MHDLGENAVEFELGGQLLRHLEDGAFDLQLPSSLLVEAHVGDKHANSVAYGCQELGFLAEDWARGTISDEEEAVDLTFGAERSCKLAAKLGMAREDPGGFESILAFDNLFWKVSMGDQRQSLFFLIQEVDGADVHAKDFEDFVEDVFERVLQVEGLREGSADVAYHPEAGDDALI
jgi:hypothetical protein